MRRRVRPGFIRIPCVKAIPHLRSARALQNIAAMKAFLIAAALGVIATAFTSCAREREIEYKKLEFHHNLFNAPGDSRPFTGVARDSYPDGKKKAEFPIKDGRFHGTVREWYQNGKPSAETEFKDGERTGQNREWMEDGKLFRERVYDHDHIVSEKNHGDAK